MTKCVVDLLEPVEVNEQQGARPSRAGGTGERMVETVEEQRPVR